MGNSTGRCAHCGRVAHYRPRNLCDDCHADLLIREQYPMLSTKGSGIGMVTPTATPKPTSEVPGSEQKLQVMIRRAELEQALHHEDDAGPCLE